MFMNVGHLSFNSMGDLILLPMKFHINELSMVKTLYFAEVVNIVGVHIKMDKSKEKLINIHIKDGKIINFKECAEGIFYTNINELTMTTNPTNVSLND